MAERPLLQGQLQHPKLCGVISMGKFPLKTRMGFTNHPSSDGYDDYLDLNPKTGALKAYLNDGEDEGSEYGWKFNPIGEIASGLGPGHRVRIADIDGDGVSITSIRLDSSSQKRRDLSC